VLSEGGGLDEAAQRIVELVAAQSAVDRAPSRRRAQLEFIADAIPAHVCYCDTEARYQVVSASYARRHGLRPDDLVGRHVSEVIGLDAYEGIRKHVEEVLAGREVAFEMDLPNERPGPRAIGVTYSPDLDAGNVVRGFVAVITDITDQKSAERALCESREVVTRLNLALRRRAAELQALLDVIPIGICIAQGANAEQMIANAAMTTALAVPAGINVSGSGPPGERIDFAMFRHGLPLAVQDAPMQRAARGETVLDEEFDLVARDGTRRCFRGYAVPLFDESGRPRGSVGAFVDITDRVRAEEQVRLAERLEAVAKLAGGTAHEINNMMAVVIGFGDLILRDLPLGHRHRADVAEMVRAGRRAAEVTHQLLAYSRQQVLRPVELELSEVLLALRPAIEQRLGAGHALALTAPSEPVRTRVDRLQLEQVLFNLVVNARDAMPDGGRLGITLEIVELDEVYARAHTPASVIPGRYALLTMSDSGTGMDGPTRDRAFDPFFTTKPQGQGTGLGLSFAYGVVKQSGGHIWLYSEPGLGTVAKVYLPLAGSEEVPARTSRAPASGTILIVEDEEPLREVARRMLEIEGYRVLDARSGPAALELLAGPEGAEVQLMVTDLIMPGMGGRELAHRALELRPRLALLYTSGYRSDDMVARGLLEPHARFIPKPFEAGTLQRAVRDALTALATG
jgi:PAS domain S-box-containing protein